MTKSKELKGEIIFTEEGSIDLAGNNTNDVREMRFRINEYIRRIEIEAKKRLLTKLLDSSFEKDLLN